LKLSGRVLLQILARKILSSKTISLLWHKREKEFPRDICERYKFSKRKIWYKIKGFFIAITCFCHALCDYEIIPEGQKTQQNIQQYIINACRTMISEYLEILFIVCVSSISFILMSLISRIADMRDMM